MSDENKAIIRRFYDAFLTQGDIAVADGTVASDMVDNVITPKDPVEPEGYRRGVEMVRCGLPNLEATIDDMMSERNKVAVLGTLRGTHDGHLM